MKFLSVSVYLCDLLARDTLNLRRDTLNHVVQGVWLVSNSSIILISKKYVDRKK